MIRRLLARLRDSWVGDDPDPEPATPLRWPLAEDLPETPVYDQVRTEALSRDGLAAEVESWLGREIWS